VEKPKEDGKDISFPSWGAVLYWVRKEKAGSSKELVDNFRQKQRLRSFSYTVRREPFQGSEKKAARAVAEGRGGGGGKTTIKKAERL